MLLHENNHKHNYYRFSHKFAFIFFLSFILTNQKQESGFQQVVGLVMKNISVLTKTRNDLKRPTTSYKRPETTYNEQETTWNEQETTWKWPPTSKKRPETIHNVWDTAYNDLNLSTTSKKNTRNGQQLAEFEIILQYVEAATRGVL